MNNPSILSQTPIANLGNILSQNAISSTDRKCWKIRRNRKSFKDRIQAIEYIRSNFLGEAFSFLTSKIGKPIYEEKGEAEIEVKISLTWILDCSKSRINMISISWSKMTESDSKAVDKFHQDLLFHEEGHMIVAKDVASNCSGEITANGKDRNEATSNLQEKLNEKKARTFELLEEQNKKYDEVTDHGRRQSNGPSQGFPGGNDVILSLE